MVFLTFIRPCIANIFSGYNQQDATLLNLFISVRRSTCFRQFFCPSSGAHNCTYSIRHLSDLHCYLQVAVMAWKMPDTLCAVLSPWRRMEKPSETCRASYRNRLRRVASWWLYPENMYVRHSVKRRSKNRITQRKEGVGTVCKRLQRRANLLESSWCKINSFIQQHMILSQSTHESHNIQFLRNIDKEIMHNRILINVSDKINTKTC